MLSQMLKPLFEGNPLTVLPIVALAIFLVVFFAVSVRVLARKATTFDDLARLPLDDGEVPREDHQV
jgi:hypothetical protein